MADKTPKKRGPQRGTRERIARASLAVGNPNDPLDVEINKALDEGRPVDMEAAFPNPPPPLAPVRTRRRVTKPEFSRANGSDIPVAVAVPKGQENSPETHAKRAAKAGIVDTGTIVPDPDDVVPSLPSASSTPADRLNQMSRVAPHYQLEFRLRLLHRLLMRGLPMDVIASQMQISVSTAKDMRAQLYRRLAAEAAASFDMNLYVGKTEAFYNELRGLAMRMVDDNGKKNPDGTWVEPPPTRDQKMRAIGTALSVEADRHRFYGMTGVFQSMPFRPDAIAGDLDKADNAARVMDLVQAVISGDVDAVYKLPELGEDDGDASLLG